jgi:phosphoglycerate dehydrogenase-like enzyme
MGTDGHAELNVVVFAPNLGRDLTYVTDVDPCVRAVDGSLLSPDEQTAALSDAEVLVVGWPSPGGLASRAPRLRWAHHTQAGVSNLYGSDLWTSPAVLTSTRGLGATTAIAEYVIAATLFFTRGLHEATRRRGLPLSRDGYELWTLAGSTMGIVGFGGIGREVARLAKGMGMRTVATRRSATEPGRDGDADLVLPPGRLRELAAESDVLAICTQLTAETTRMIDGAVLAELKPTALLVNVARGEIVDEDALVAALTGGRLAGAVLDVYEGEIDGKPPRPELVELPQVLLTPHISGLGDRGVQERQRAVFADNLRRYLDGLPLVNEVDRARGY